MTINYEMITMIENQKENNFKEAMDWMNSEFNNKENTLYDDYDDKDYSQTDYIEEEKYLYDNKEKSSLNGSDEFSLRIH